MRLVGRALLSASVIILAAVRLIQGNGVVDKMDKEETDRWMEVIKLINDLPIEKQKPFADLIEGMIRDEV